jgi:hypothetical protein
MRGHEQLDDLRHRGERGGRVADGQWTGDEWPRIFGRSTCGWSRCVWTSLLIE